MCISACTFELPCSQLRTMSPPLYRSVRAHDGGAHLRSLVHDGQVAVDVDLLEGVGPMQGEQVAVKGKARRAQIPDLGVAAAAGVRGEEDLVKGEAGNGVHGHPERHGRGGLPASATL